uniref:Uncharacterized protein n=1 Tax=Anguilla anguilla TaxID=7936 RepID=A0A0E9UZD0_ANGAN
MTGASPSPHESSVVELSLHRELTTSITYKPINTEPAPVFKNTLLYVIPI